MIQIENKDCKIFTDNIEPEALETIYKLAKSQEFEGTKIRIMPDVHQGKGIVIGFTAPLGKYVNPEHVGCDIGCTISAIFFSERLKEENYPLFEHRVKEAIPQGTKLQKETQFEVKEFLKFLRSEIQKAHQSSNGLVKLKEFNSEKDIEDWCKGVGMDLGVFYKSVGTLGSGNHFMEYGIGMSPDTNILGYPGIIAGSALTPYQAFTVHTGSRNLGLKVFNKWNKVAKEGKISKEGERKIIDEVKARVSDKTKLKDEIKKAIDEYRLTIHPGYLTGENMFDYLTDVAITQAYAKWNHKIILDIVAKIHNKLAKGKIITTVQTTHNYVDFDTVDGVPMIRKGAVRANKKEIFLVPFNMRDGIAVCHGKGNEDWNYSCCHGAGRIMSRAKAKELLDMEEFKETMKDVYSTSVCKNTLDEAPMAYKNKDEIVSLIKPTCHIGNFIKPVINIKCGEEERYY